MTEGRPGGRSDLMPKLRSDPQQLGFLSGRQDYPLRRDAIPQDLDLSLSSLSCALCLGMKSWVRKTIRRENVEFIAPDSTTEL